MATREFVHVRNVPGGCVIQLREAGRKGAQTVISEVALTPAQVLRLVNKLANLGVRAGNTTVRHKESDSRKRNKYIYGRPWTSIQHLNKKAVGRPLKNPIT